MGKKDKFKFGVVLLEKNAREIFPSEISYIRRDLGYQAPYYFTGYMYVPKVDTPRNLLIEYTLDTNPIDRNAIDDLFNNNEEVD